MPETRRLYYEEPETAEGEATVLETVEDGGYAVVLDRSVFFPEGGGQPCDLGSIGGIPISAVIEKEGRILHYLERGAGFAAGGRVAFSLDKARRRDHTQQHSGQHLLSAILEEEFGIHTIGFHLGIEYSTIDISAEGIDRRHLERIEALSEAFIGADRPIVVHSCPPEDISSFRLRRKPPAGEKILRVVEIDNYDWSPCCGTHAASMGSLRMLLVLGWERYKKNTRLYFAAGDRAVEACRRAHETLKEMSLTLGSSPAEAPARLDALAKRIEAAEGERVLLLRERARLEVDARIALCEEMGASAGVQAARPLRFTYSDRPIEAVLETAKAASARGWATVAVSLPDRTVIAMAPQDWRGEGLGRLCKPLMLEGGGKGGGGKVNFRAEFPSAESAGAFADKAAALMEAGRTV